MTLNAYPSAGASGSGGLPDPPTTDGDYALRLQDGVLSWVQSPDFLNLSARRYRITDNANTKHSLAILDDYNAPTLISWGDALANAFDSTVGAPGFAVTDGINTILLTNDGSDPTKLSINATVTLGGQSLLAANAIVTNRFALFDNNGNQYAVAKLDTTVGPSTVQLGDGGLDTEILANTFVDSTASIARFGEVRADNAIKLKLDGSIGVAAQNGTKDWVLGDNSCDITFVGGGVGSPTGRFIIGESASGSGTVAFQTPNTHADTVRFNSRILDSTGAQGVAGQHLNSAGAAPVVWGP